METVTISRQLGSLGTEVGHRVGECLGYRVVWREIINQAARQAGAHEMALATIDDLGLLKLRPTFAARRAYHRALEQIVVGLADGANVVIIRTCGSGDPRRKARQAARPGDRSRRVAGETRRAKAWSSGTGRAPAGGSQ